MMYRVAETQTETASPMRPFAPEGRTLVQRKCACGGSSGMGGACAECSNERLNVARRPVSDTRPNVRATDSSRLTLQDRQPGWTA